MKQTKHKYHVQKSRTKYSNIQYAHVNTDIERVEKFLRDYNKPRGGYIKVFRVRGKRNLKLLEINSGELVFSNGELDSILKNK